MSFLSIFFVPFQQSSAWPASLFAPSDKVIGVCFFWYDNVEMDEREKEFDLKNRPSENKLFLSFVIALRSLRHNIQYWPVLAERASNIMQESRLIVNCPCFADRLSAIHTKCHSLPMYIGINLVVACKERRKKLCRSLILTLLHDKPRE